MDALAEKLKAHGIKPSYTRMRIFEYLYSRKTHPTVDEIYSKLVKEIPTLSKTTVYNTLSLLVEHGIARSMSLENKEMRFDGNVRDHGHFKCSKCGRVYDFFFDVDQIHTEELDGFKVEERNIYFSGTCEKCTENIDI